jgi:D-tyrosyl-tRNA(Tyr) deacylase
MGIGVISNFYIEFYIYYARDCRMKMLIQRVSDAAVYVEGSEISRIGKGFLVFLGVGKGDTKEQADKLVKKMTGLRIFPDSEDKINLALKDVQGEVLIVSQFTLYADTKKGFRPSFTDASLPEEAQHLYHYVVDETRKLLPVVKTGSFGAHMEITLTNDGPFTILLEA